MKSKEAKEFIKLSQGFHTLFKNDASLAEDLLSKTARKEGSALATSISGAYAQKLVKGLFDFTFRFLPQSFMFGFFKSSIQGAALRHHLRHALQKSVSVDEFNHTLKHSLSKSQFNSQTRKLADELMSELEQTSKALDEEAWLMSKSLEEKSEQKEARGLYNVSFNGKNATLIRQDLHNVESAIKYTQGNGDKGAKHIVIRHLLDKDQEGFITKEELLNLGVNVRKFLQEHKEPFIDDRGARVYEWQDKEGVRFRLVVANPAQGGGQPRTITNNPSPTTKSERIARNSSDLQSDEIITFYSDRNLKEPMKFKNPALQADEMNEALSNEALSQARQEKENLPSNLDIITQTKKGQKVQTSEIIKLLKSSPQKGDGKILIGLENLNSEVIEWAVKNNKKIPINSLDDNTAKTLGFKKPHKITRTITPSEVIHTLKRHGENSALVKNGNQKAVTLNDIANYQSYADTATKKQITKDKQGNDLLISGKQINGYYVVVEQIRNGVSELSFKDMYFEFGSLEKSNAFKNTNTRK